MCIHEGPETTLARVLSEMCCRGAPSSERSSEADRDDLALLPSGLEGITEGGEPLRSTPKLRVHFGTPRDCDERHRPLLASCGTEFACHGVTHSMPAIITGTPAAKQ